MPSIINQISDEFTDFGLAIAQLPELLAWDEYPLYTWNKNRKVQYDTFVLDERVDLMYEYTRFNHGGKAIYWSGKSGYLLIYWYTDDYNGPAVKFYIDGKVEKLNYYGDFDRYCGTFITYEKGSNWLPVET